ncbi:hypothetical protein [Ramlibacter sp. WS9]|uniref:hypothetical protein n=1 Tax=Ramlibacter sp. WS9 TaxID=1882741 RepID=UPI00114157BB|nr:hypothetical protein [Ramlibacter sp. WS9]ROZ74913.1 hypothetical protein EEB15_16105 [Ramlibacter sp. WS9]
MRAAEIVWAWIAAIAVVSAVSTAVVLSDTRFDGAQIAVVGSSLMLHAIPPSGLNRDAVLGDGRSHRRIGVRSISEKELLSLAARALDERAALVLLEVNPLIRDFPGPDDESCTDWLTSLRTTVHLKRRAIAGATRRALGLAAREPAMAEAIGLDERSTQIERQLALHYPLHLREPRCRQELNRIVAAAHRQGAQVVLVLPPRSNTAHAYLGQSQAVELELRARRLAHELGTPLFDAGSPWPDHEFVDHAHLASSGRERFLRELRHWWRRHP